MILTTQQSEWLQAEKGVRGEVIDLDTGLKVPMVIRLKSDMLMVEAYRVDRKGEVITDIAGQKLTYLAKGRFKLIPLKPKLGARITSTGAALKCARCPSALVLPGDELCPKCKAVDRNQKNKFVVEPITDIMIARKCCYKGCTKTATMMVVDEVEVSPVVGLLRSKKYLWSRGATVGRRCYCQWHWKPPQLLDSKGEIIKQFDPGKVTP